MSDLARAAMAYAQELGWAVFPLQPRSKNPLAGSNGLKDATTNAEQIAAWWTQNPAYNIGISTGDASGFVVLDLDGPEAEAAILGWGLPIGPVQLTGKGRHLLFQRPDGGVRNSAGKLAPKLDVRGDGGYIVAAPSIHPDGHRYRWDRATHPSVTPLAPLPDHVVQRMRGERPPLALVTDQAVAKRAADIPTADVIGEGQRNQTLTEYAGRLLATGLGELEVLELVRGLNASKVSPPLPDGEVYRIVSNIASRERVQRRSRHTPQASPPDVAQVVRVDRPLLDALSQRIAEPIDAVPTPLDAWNDACRGFGGGEGFARGWNVVVGGASGTGKSLVALNVSRSVLAAGHSVGYVSLEMSADQLLTRMLAIWSGVSVRDLEPGRQHHAPSYARALGSWTHHAEDSGAEFLIVERPRADLPSIEAACRSLVDAGCRLIVLDYLQLVHVPRADFVEATLETSHAMQRLAFGANVTTLTLSQYNRSQSATREQKPTIYGLAGSSAIENDADQVALLDHTAYERTGNRAETTLILAKNRHGPVVDLPIRWDFTTLQLMTRIPDPAETADKHGIHTGGASSRPKGYAA